MTNEQLAAYAAGAPCPHIDVMAMADEITQLRGNLSLAEEGLANATQESASLITQRDHWLEIAREKDVEIAQLKACWSEVLANVTARNQEIAREKDSLIDTQDAAQTSLHAENVRLREENEQLQSRLEGSQAAAAVGEREIEQLTKQRDEGWNNFYALRKQVAEQTYPGMTRVVHAHEPSDDLGASMRPAPEADCHCSACEMLRRMNAEPSEGTPRGAGSGKSGGGQ